MGQRVMSEVKKKAKKLESLNNLSIDIANYNQAAVSNPKFESYYFSKIEEAEAEKVALKDGE